MSNKREPDTVKRHAKCRPGGTCWQTAPVMDRYCPGGALMLTPRQANKHPIGRPLDRR